MKGCLTTYSFRNDSPTGYARSSAKSYSKPPAGNWCLDVYESTVNHDKIECENIEDGAFGFS